MNLRGIEEESLQKNTLTLKFLSILIIAISFITTSIILNYINAEDDLIYKHLSLLGNIIILFIFMPKCFINQDENLKLYLSVYHHHPPPVLPWQLPKDFDSKTVKLIVAKYNKE